MIDAKKKDVLAGHMSGSGVEPSCTAKNAYEQQQIAMRSLCMVCKVPFRRLLEAVEQSRDNICKGVHAVVCSILNTTVRIVQV